MAGTVYDLISTFGGLNLKGDHPALDPLLPPHWKGLEYRFTFRGAKLGVAVSGNSIEISAKKTGKDKIKVHLYGKEIELSQNEPVSISLT